MCESAITDPKFWAYLRILEYIAEFIRRISHWAEWCPCHWDRVHVLSDADDPISKELLKTWQKCPLRGCRGPCLAAGEFFNVMRDLSTVIAAEVSLNLPTDISDADRRWLIGEFNAGRSHLVFYFTLKLAHWSSPPWSAYRLGHWNPDQAYDAWEECTTSTNPHPLIRDLKDETIFAEGSLWFEGASAQLHDTGGVNYKFVASGSSRSPTLKWGVLCLSWALG